jgi:hypothetical protein
VPLELFNVPKQGRGWEGALRPGFTPVWSPCNFGEFLAFST